MASAIESDELKGRERERGKERERERGNVRLEIFFFEFIALVGKVCAMLRKGE